MKVESPESRVQRQRQGRIVRRHRPASPALDSRLSTLDSPKSGFTLTELLVVMLIMVILVVMTVAVVNFGFAAERSRSAARQIQSYLAGARDRAINEKRAVGVRFLIDGTVPGTSTSMVFIEQLDPWTQGTIRLERFDELTNDPDNPPSDWVPPPDRVADRPGVLIVRGSVGTEWKRLANMGLLDRNSRIKIFPISAVDSGFWYTIKDGKEDPNNPGEILLELTTAVVGADDQAFPAVIASERFHYALALPPTVRPSQEPMLLPRGIAIDLRRSKPTTFWGGNTPDVNRRRLEVMFSPGGTVIGKVASGGLIHFYLAETVDIERLNDLSFGSQIPSDASIGSGADAEPVGDRIIVTLFPQTGAISSHPVDPTAGSNAKVAKDPFFFAETGEVAGE